MVLRTFFSVAYRVAVLGAVAELGWSSHMRALSAVAAAMVEGPEHGEFGSGTVKVGTTPREYRLVVPESVDLSKPASLVVAFHGMLIDSKDVMPRYTRLTETAEKYGFIIVYPEAIGKSWGIVPEKVKNDLAFFD